MQVLSKGHGFSSQRTSHGNSVSHRAIGSTGMCQDPGECLREKNVRSFRGCQENNSKSTSY